MISLSDLRVPHNEKKVLLHSCCAPCSCSILRQMIESGIEPTVYFYNPNIYPKEEYEHRKKEVVRYAQKMKIPFVDIVTRNDMLSRFYNLQRSHGGGRSGG